MAFNQHPRPLYNPQAAMGRSIRIEQYRYTEWRRPGKEPSARELYEYGKGVKESDNLVDHPEYAPLIKKLTAQLNDGWQVAQPPATPIIGVP